MLDNAVNRLVGRGRVRAAPPRRRDWRGRPAGGGGEGDALIIHSVAA
jgi:hypothetical protein